MSHSSLYIIFMRCQRVFRIPVSRVLPPGGALSFSLTLVIRPLAPETEDPPVGDQDVLHPAADLAGGHIVASAAFQMVDDGGKLLELRRTKQARAFVQMLTICMQRVRSAGTKRRTG
jgi:hypothetical protein